MLKNLLCFLMVLTFVSFTMLPVDAATALSDDFPADNAIVFSHPAGVYDEGFELVLFSGDESTIYYTTDGSLPDISSNAATIQYGGPIRIEKEISAPVYAKYIDVPRQFNPEYRVPSEIRKATVIRAVAVDKSGIPGKTETASYFVDLFDGKDQRLGVVSVTGSPYELFDIETGVYNDTDPDETKAIVNVEYFRENGDLVFSYDAQTRIFGGFTRNYAQRSLILDFSKGVSKDRIRYPLFGTDSRDIYGQTVKSFDRLRLHSGGNDSKLTTFLDGMFMKLSMDMEIGTNPYVPVIAFLNGEYWGLYALREDFKEDYFEKHYHVPEENVIAVKIVWGCDNVPTVTMGEGSDLRYYEEMYSFLENQDFKNDVVYRHFIDYYMDENSFIDFYIANLYVNNIDWPGNNVRMWRSREAQTDQSPLADTRWRFILHDIDAGFKDQSKEMFTILLKKGAGAVIPTSPPYDDWATLPFRKMSQNQNFVEKFTNRMLVHLNSTYEKQLVLDTIDEYSAQKYAFVDEHKDRWGQSAAFPYTQMVSQLKAFAYTRTEKILGLMNQYFDSGSAAQIEFAGLDGDGDLEIGFGDETLKLSNDIDEKLVYAFTGSELTISDTSAAVKGFFVRESGKYRYVRGSSIVIVVSRKDMKIIPVRFDLKDSLFSVEGITISIMTILLLGLIIRGSIMQKRKVKEW